MIRLIGITDDDIVALGIVVALLFIQLELKIIVCVDVEIDASNHAEVEGLARKMPATSYCGPAYKGPSAIMLIRGQWGCSRKALEEVDVMIV